MQSSENLNGIIIIDKPINYTSRDVVNIIGKIFKTKKVGHTGTLDPIATGVLIVCINKATKIAELLTSTDKEYIAEFIFGTLTDTLDTTGTILEEKIALFSEEEIRKVLKEMLGSYNQEVPIYSAVKVNGKKLYEYARNNIDVELPKHLVNIKELELLNYKQENNKTIIQVRCLVSKGTYIRALGNDIAKKLDSIAIMKSLRRTKQGSFSISDSHKIEDLEINKYQLIDIVDALDYPKIEIDEIFKKKLQNGLIIDNNYVYETILFIHKGKAVALYKTYEKDKTKLKPWKMLEDL